MKLKDIKEKVREARDDAEDEARYNTGNVGVVRSRGMHLYGHKNDTCILGEAESWEWDGTLRDLNKAIAFMEKEGGHRLYICGGFNWAKSLDDMNCDEYEPWVSDWSVDVWTKT